MQRIKLIRLTYLQLYLITLVLAIGAYFFVPYFVERIPALQEPLKLGADLAMLLFVLPVFLTGKPQTRLVLAAIAVCGFLLEYFGTLTGLPYGRFQYNDQFGINLLGTPLVIGLAWVGIVTGATVVASRITRKRIYKLLLSTIIIVAVDLVIDPAAVNMSYWTWQQTGPYYGIPFSNFAGWFIAGFILSVVRFKFAAGLTTKQRKLAVASVFLITAFWTNISLFLGLWIPVAVGIVLMAVFSGKLDRLSPV